MDWLTNKSFCAILVKDWWRSVLYLAKRKTNDEFLKEIFSLVGDEYVFMDDYIGSNIKLRIQHKKCGSVYEITPHGFLTGSRCYKCFCDNRDIARRKTNEQFLSEV